MACKLPICSDHLKAMAHTKVGWVPCQGLGYFHQYSLCILYNPSPELCIADWLSQNNHSENRDQEITGMNANMHATSTAVGILIYTSIKDIQAATSQDLDLQRLKAYIIGGWPYTKDEVEYSVQKNWQIRYELMMTDGTAMKDKWIIIPYILWNQILEHLYSNH